jgi:hypothetical protein
MFLPLETEEYRAVSVLKVNHLTPFILGVEEQREKGYKRSFRADCQQWFPPSNFIN